MFAFAGVDKGRPVPGMLRRKSIRREVAEYQSTAGACPSQKSQFSSGGMAAAENGPAFNPAGSHTFALLS